MLLTASSCCCPFFVSAGHACMRSCSFRLCVVRTQLHGPVNVWYACIMHTQLIAAHATGTSHSGCPVLACCGLFQSSMTFPRSPAKHLILLQFVVHGLSSCSATHAGSTEDEARMRLLRQCCSLFQGRHPFHNYTKRRLYRIRTAHTAGG